MSTAKKRKDFDEIGDDGWCPELEEKERQRKEKRAAALEKKKRDARKAGMEAGRSNKALSSFPEFMSDSVAAGIRNAFKEGYYKGFMEMKNC